jgi:hypothetical protein
LFVCDWFLAIKQGNHFLIFSLFPSRLPLCRPALQRHTNKMRHKRAKQYKKAMALYQHNFHFREPYQVLGAHAH